MKSHRNKVIVAAVIGVLLVSWYGISRVRDAERNKPIIRTAEVERGTVTRTVSASGILQPLTTVDVKSNAGGRIDVLAVDVGTIVQPGQLIARIDPTDSQTALDQAQANLSSSNARLYQAKESLTLQVEQSVQSVKQAEQAYEAAKARLAQTESQAKVQPALTKAAIQQAEANFRSAQESLRQLKTAGVPQGMAQAKAADDQARASLDKSERNYSRQQELFAKGFVSASQLESAKADYENAKAQAASARERAATSSQDYDAQLKVSEARMDQAKAALDNAKANAVQDKIREQEVTAARAALRQAQASLETARANVRQNRIKEADIRSAEAQTVGSKVQVENAKAQLDYTIITAPRAGIILQRYVEQGTIIASARSSIAGAGQGTSLVQLGDMSRMFVLASVDETDIAQVEVGQGVDIVLDAYPNEIFEGVVTRIDPQTVVEQNVTTIPVTVEIEDPDIRLKPGMNATCEFVVERSVDALIVPSEAVTDQGGGRYTVEVMKGDAVVEREVEVGVEGDENTEIISGLKEGDRVVTAVIESGSAGRSRNGSPMDRSMGGPPPGAR